MTFPSLLSTNSVSWRGPIRLGFLPVTDSAPVIMAQELGIFSQYDLGVTLHRERDETLLRDKFVEGELDAIQASATLPFLLSLGIGCEPCASVTGLILGLQGNAITVSNELSRRGVADATSLGRLVLEEGGRRTFTFGVPHLASTQSLLLRHWLRLGGVDPDRQVRLLAVPPMELYPHMKLGYLDGFCASEPWNSVVVEAGMGCCVATSAELAPLHPEKVLVVRRDFARERAEEHLRLSAALIESCRFCDVPKNWGVIRNALTHFNYVNAPMETLISELGVPFNLGLSTVTGFHQFAMFHRHHANAPTRERALWMLDQMVLHRVLPPVDLASRQKLLATYSNEAFSRAHSLVAQQWQSTLLEERVLAEAAERGR
jgi:ABC-type nitrate/sulfonate/bicarbonate transport system substrate-binding protein